MSCYQIRNLIIGGLLIGVVAVTGCVPSPSYDRWTVDIVLLENNTVVVQSFRNVTVDEQSVQNEEKRARYQKWFCDDSSDTFQREWKSYADRLGMRSIDSTRVETRGSAGNGCDIQISGSGQGFLPTATVLTNLLKSDTYSVSKRGQRFELDIEPTTIRGNVDFEFNLWLSNRYPGRLLDANTAEFSRNLDQLRIGIQRVYAGTNAQATSWRRAYWTTEQLSREGIQFVLEGPLHGGANQSPGIDNRPTHFPGVPATNNTD